MVTLKIEHGILCLVGGIGLAGLVTHNWQRVSLEYSGLGFTLTTLLTLWAGGLLYLFILSAVAWMHEGKKDSIDLVWKVVSTISRWILAIFGAILMYFMWTFLGALFGGCIGMFVSGYQTGDPYALALPYTIGGMGLAFVLVTAKLIADNTKKLDAHAEL